jgi:hypothetical protein
MIHLAKGRAAFGNISNREALKIQTAEGGDFRGFASFGLGSTA